MLKKAESPARRDGERRPHLFRLAAGVLDSRFNHVDFLDTVGGEELRRLYRHSRHPSRGKAQP